MLVTVSLFFVSCTWNVINAWYVFKLLTHFLKSAVLCLVGFSSTSIFFLHFSWPARPSHLLLFLAIETSLCLLETGSHCYLGNAWDGMQDAHICISTSSSARRAVTLQLSGLGTSAGVLSVAVINTHQKRLGEERVSLIYILWSWFVTEGNHSRNLEARDEWSLWGILAYWLAPSDLLLQTTCPGVSLPAVGWALLHPSLIKKMPHSRVYKPVWWRQLLS